MFFPYFRYQRINQTFNIVNMDSSCGNDDYLELNCDYTDAVEIDFLQTTKEDIQTCKTFISSGLR